MIEFIEIKKSHIISNDEKVFDLEVEKDHSFVVGDGLIVHNCLTRRQTGCGRPQFSAIVECADAAHQVGGMVCSDGGITCPGDLGKAFGAGADMIMIGSLFAGTDEAEGEIIEKYVTNGEYDMILEHPYIEKKKFKQFYGMSSTLAQEKFGNGKPSYRASEGRITLMPYTGPIQDIIEELLGGLRSTMTYIGAKKLKDIPKQCVFYKVHNQLNQMYERNTIGKQKNEKVKTFSFFVTKNHQVGTWWIFFDHLLHHCDWETSVVRSILSPKIRLCTRITFGLLSLQGFTLLLARCISQNL